MKKVLVQFVIFGVLGIGFYNHFSKLDFKTPNKQLSESAPIFNKESSRYEFERLRDPNTGKIPANIRAKELNYALGLPGSIRNMNSKNEFLQSELWKQRGPYEVGGRTRALALDIRDENVMIAGGVSGGMWKSTNAGLSWFKTTKPDQVHSVTCLVQDTRKGKEDIWYYGTGEYFGNSASISGDGVFKSTDNGNSWFQLLSTSTFKPQTFENPFDYIFNIAINPIATLDKDEIYVATSYNGIFKSIDGGKVWTKTLTSGSIWSDITVSENGTFFATLSSKNVTNQGLYQSTDGIKWINITPKDFPKTYNRVVIGIADPQADVVYFLGETPGYGIMTKNSQGDELFHSLWKYTNFKDEAKFTDLSNNLPSQNFEIRGQMNSQWGYNLVLKVRPDNPNVVFIGATAMYRSDDGFSSKNVKWIGGTCPFGDCDYLWRYPNHHADLHAIVFSKSNNNVLFTGSDGGVHKTLNNTADTVDWISLNNGYFTTQFYCIAIPHKTETTDIIIGGLQDNGTLLSVKDDLNQNWQNPTRGDGFWCQVSNSPNMYYTSSNSSSQPKIIIYRAITNDDGSNKILTRIDPIGGKDFIWNTPFTLDPNNTNIMYLAGGKMVWRNKDLSEIPLINSKDSTSINWDSLSFTRIDYNNTEPLGERVSAIEISTKPANVLYYGTSGGRVYRIDNANIGNPKPTQISTSSMPRGSNVGCIAIDPDDADNIFAVYTNYGILSIYNSTDGGLSWTPVSGNLEENIDGSGVGPQVNWLEIIKVKGKKVYFAGTSAGLYSTAFIHGMGTVWRQEGASTIGNVVVDVVDARLSDSYVAVGTHGVGIFTTFYNEIPELPGVTSLVSPINNTKDIRTTVDLEWSTSYNTGSYDLEVATDSEFKNIFASISGIKGTKYQLSALEEGYKNYYWRVRANSSAGTSNYTETWSFKTIIGQPNLIYPADAERKLQLSLTLKWENLVGATKYRIQVAKGLNFAKPILDSVINSSQINIDGLEAGKKYIWHVSAFDNEIIGQYSKTFSFWTDEALSVKYSTLANNNIKLYPNPVSDNVNLDFSIDKSSPVIIQLIDLAGRKLQEFDNRIYLPGNYKLNLNLKSYTVGNYFVLIKIDNETQFKAINILK